MTEGGSGAVIMAGMAMVIVMDGVIVVAMGTEMDMDMAETGMVDTNKDTRNPMATRNLSMSRLQYTIHLSNRPVSVCFFRLTFVSRWCHEFLQAP